MDRLTFSNTPGLCIQLAMSYWAGDVLQKSLAAPTAIQTAVMAFLPCLAETEAGRGTMGPQTFPCLNSVKRVDVQIYQLGLSST